MQPTQQQQSCVAAAKKHSIVKIEAAAGAGKTSTLKLVSMELPEPSIYVAFNKTTATEATEKFPKHVTCKTTHSLAYAKFGANLRDKLNRPKGGYINVAFTGTEIARFYKVGCIIDEFGIIATTENAIGLFVRQTVERYEQSADTELNEKHLPKFDMDKTLRADPKSGEYVVRLAKRLWADRIDTGKPVMATHDTYLKLFQLSKPNLKFAIIYADEFQDTTPCVMDIVMSQASFGSKIILVGDQFQAIYAWRGAVNALGRVQGHSEHLTKSFRFGQGIADVATAILQGQMKLTGRDDMPSTIGRNVVDRTKPYMYLFRTNSALLYAAVAAISNGEDIRLEIDVKDFLRLLQSAYALSKKDMKNVKHENILPYPTWEEYVAEADKIKGEMKRIVNIIDGGDYFRFVRTLENFHNPDEAHVIYTTAHKSKGREHHQVVLADDFPSHYDGGNWIGLNEMEQNLLYVAVTRAQYNLEVNDSVEEAMQYYQSVEPSLYDKEGPVAHLGINGEQAVEAMHREMGLDEGMNTRFQGDLRREIRDMQRDYAWQGL